MHLKEKDWRRLWRKKAAPKVPEWPSYGNFCKVTQNPHFLKKVQKGDQEKFVKITQNVALVWKAQKHSRTQRGYSSKPPNIALLNLF